ncbi:UNVERIFIED_CONTAM: Metastasis-associated protein mta1 [Gekko kuhli]
MPINSAAIKAECSARLPEATENPLLLKQVVRKPLEAVLRYLEFHPCPLKPDPTKRLSGSLNSVPCSKFSPVINNGSPTILGKRSYEQHNGMDGTMKKRLLMPSKVPPVLVDAQAPASTGIPLSRPPTNAIISDEERAPEPPGSGWVV